MVWMSRFATSPRAGSRSWFRVKSLAGLLLAFAAGGAACSSNDDGTSSSTMEPGTCEGGGGPVMSTMPDDHCKDSSGMDITQEVGMCQTSVEADGAAAGGDEEYGTYYGSQGNDDDCKYDVSFTHTCIKVNEPVTFSLQLKHKSDGTPATDADPSHPEIFLEEGSHPSPSNRIKAPEGPDGSYQVGPIVFDRPGRWVVRFHFYEGCSDIPEDSPHGHASFYIDVP